MSAFQFKIRIMKACKQNWNFRKIWETWSLFRFSFLSPVPLKSFRWPYIACLEKIFVRWLQSIKTMKLWIILNLKNNRLISNAESQIITSKIKISNQLFVSSCLRYKKHKIELFWEVISEQEKNEKRYTTKSWFSKIALVKGIFDQFLCFC